MEAIAIFSRWLQLVANLVLFGSCIYLAVAGVKKELFNNSWVLRLEKLFPLLASIVLMGLVGILATTTGKATGIESNIWSPNAWIKIVQSTNMGHIWAIRAASALFLLGAVIFVSLKPERVRWHYIMIASMASLPLIASTMASHAAADEGFLFYIPVYTTHILMAGIWFGALPAFLFIVFDRRNCEEKGAQLVLNVESLKKFSFLALPTMVLIILTGLIMTDRMVGDHYHTLVASTYGWSLLIKIFLLAIILLIASRARSKWLPSFERICEPINYTDSEKRENNEGNSLFSKFFSKTTREKNNDYGEDTPSSGVEKLRKWVRIEYVLELLLVLFATILSNSMPAKHTTVENWPYSFRFTLDGTLGVGTWEDVSVQFFLVLGIILFITAISTFLLGRRKNKNSRKYNIATVFITLACAVVTLPQFSIDAYPETYRNTPIPFDAISISNGSDYFSEYCADCHGPQGLGDGILAKTLLHTPSDLLTDPYVTRYMDGDFFHWISYGIEGTEMPGFYENLEEEDRWDIVNYIRAASSGYQSRWLNPVIAAHAVLPKAPDFQFTTHSGITSTLKEYQQDKNVLLVFFSWPESAERLAELSENYEKIKNLNTVILTVPLDEHSKIGVANFINIRNNLEVVEDGWLEIKDSYSLYRRTLRSPDIQGKGSIPSHMEFIVDPFRYMRARWMPTIDQSGWDGDSLVSLTSQLQQLNQEKKMLLQSHDHTH
jgi:putative copper resistance protein D